MKDKKHAIEIRTGDTPAAINSIYDVFQTLKHDDVVSIHGIRFVVRWRKGALLLVPKGAESMLISLGWTSDRYERASGNQITRAAVDAWRALGLHMARGDEEVDGLTELRDRLGEEYIGILLDQCAKRDVDAAGLLRAIKGIDNAARIYQADGPEALAAAAKYWLDHEEQGAKSGVEISPPTVV